MLLKPRTPRRRSLPWLLTAPALVLALGVAHASQSPTATADTGAATDYQPEFGQVGKDVIWIPTAATLVDEMLRMAELTPQDYLVDLGSGDGRTVITAAQRGTRAHGIEYNPNMVALSRRAAQEAGVSDKATFAQGDIFESDFSTATVVSLFLLPELNLRLRPILLDMKPGTRIVSNSFDMGDWEPDDQIEGVVECQTYCTAYKWVVPAKVEGDWTLDDKTTLALEQTYQHLNGHLMIDGARHEINNAAMQGARIAFTANGRQYTGEVEADRIIGSDSSGNSWTAMRKP